MQFEEDQAMGKSTIPGNGRLSLFFQRRPINDTPQFSLAFRPEDRNRGNLLFVRRHNSMRSTTMTCRWSAFVAI
jgi:hypothetical protein